MMRVLLADDEDLTRVALAADALTAPQYPLAPRELEGLRLAGHDTPVAVIARRTHLSSGTVRNYLAAVLTKLGVASRAEAIRTAHDKAGCSRPASDRMIRWSLASTVGWSPRPSFASIPTAARRASKSFVPATLRALWAVSRILGGSSWGARRQSPLWFSQLAAHTPQFWVETPVGSRSQVGGSGTAAGAALPADLAFDRQRVPRAPH